MTTTQAVVASAVDPRSRAVGSMSPAPSSPGHPAVQPALHPRRCSACSSAISSRAAARSSLDRGTDLLTSNLSSKPANAGLAPGPDRHGLARGHRRLVAFPIGILTAVYLEEYASPNLLTRFIDINIRNLAGVPSVVYGLLGLAIFVAVFASLGVGTGKNILSGGLTLAVLVLPLVDHHLGRGDPRRADRLARRRLRHRRLALAGRAPARPAVGGAWHPDRHRAGPVTRPRRDRAADPGRGHPRLLLERRRPRRTGCPARTPPCPSSSSTGRASRRRSSGR